MFKHSLIFALFVTIIILIPSMGLSMVSETLDSGSASLAGVILQLMIAGVIGSIIFVIAFVSDLYEQATKGNPIL